MSDFYPVAIRARMMGRYQLGSAVGGLFGVGLAGVLVDTYGWRAAFWMWIPFGVVVVLILTRLPEPERGGQDRAFHLEETERIEADNVPGLLPDLHLPEPRQSTLDYDNAVVDGGAPRAAAHPLDVVRPHVAHDLELPARRAQRVGHRVLQAGLRPVRHQGRGLRARDRRAAPPSGSIGGGELADRLLRRGMANARVYVTAVSSVLASVLLLPAFLTSSLPLAAVLLFFGSLCLTIPVAPSEALMSDVVPGELRGRAAAIRSDRARPLGPLAAHRRRRSPTPPTSPPPWPSSRPLYAVGGLVMLFAARTYPADLAFVAAEARRYHGQDSRQ